MSDTWIFTVCRGMSVLSSIFTFQVPLTSSVRSNLKTGRRQLNSGSDFCTFTQQNLKLERQWSASEKLVEFQKKRPNGRAKNLPLKVGLFQISQNWNVTPLGDFGGSVGICGFYRASLCLGCSPLSFLLQFGMLRHSSATLEGK